MRLSHNRRHVAARTLTVVLALVLACIGGAAAWGAVDLIRAGHAEAGALAMLLSLGFVVCGVWGAFVSFWGDQL